VSAVTDEGAEIKKKYKNAKKMPIFSLACGALKNTQF